MTHTYVNGFGGSVVLAAATLDVENWDLDINGEALDTTNTGDAGWETNILGCKSWSGNAKTFWDSVAVPTGAAGFTAGARGSLTLNVSAGGKSYGGTVQLTSVKISNPVKGVVTFDISFKGSGALTYAS